jgi:peptide/nickel transport system substrate-binding protein
MSTKNTIRRSALILAAAGATVGLAACGGGSKDDSPTTAAAGTTAATSSTTAAASTGAAKAGKLIYGAPAVANSLDPDGPASSDITNITAIDNLYEGLVEWAHSPNDASLGGGLMLDATKVDPGLATSWKQTDDSLTLNLRKGVKNSFGDEFTSADVVWSWKRNVGIKGTGAYIWSAPGHVTDIKAVGKYKVVMTTSQPAPILLTSLAGPYVSVIDSTQAKKHITAKDPWATKWLAKNAAGWGAYTAASYSPGRSLDLTPSPDYWDGAPQNAIDILPIPDGSNRLSALKKGDINIATGLTPEQVKTASTDSSLNVFQFKGNAGITLYPNWKVKALSNQKVRQAMQYAVPQDDIVKSVYLGYAFPLKSFVPPYVAGYTDKFWPYTYDTAKAKQLMSEAGYADGFTIDLAYASESNTMAQMAPILQSSFAQIGIKLNLKPMPQATMLSRAFGQKDLDMFTVDSGSNITPDVSNVGAIFGCGLFGNTVSYCDKAFDAAAKASESSTVMSERQPGVDDLQKVMAQDPPVILAAGIESIGVTSKNVENYTYQPNDGVPFKSMTVGDSAGN